MTIEIIRDLLLWCSIINYIVLLIWFVVFYFAHNWLYQLHTRWFKISREQFDALHYLGIAMYKIGVLLLNIVPYIALGIIL